MATPGEPWNIRPATKRAAVPAALKADVESKGQELIETVLVPWHVRSPSNDLQFYSIADIGAKWDRNYFYFFSTDACPSPNAVSPTFESTFARREPLRDGTVALDAMRHTGQEWVGVLDARSVDECLKAIRDGEWFLQ